MESICRNMPWRYGMREKSMNFPKMIWKNWENIL
jgi:hypothetical protein